MPVSATASSTHSLPLATQRVQPDLALLGELAGVAQEVEQDLPQPHGIDHERTEIVPAFDR
jgi:hypothetical protein